MKNILTKCMLMSFLFSLPLFATAMIWQELPQGNYQQSCFHCHISRYNRLKCVCKDSSGTPNRTSIDLIQQCRFIENTDGNLECTRFERNRPFPRFLPKRRDVPAGPIWNQRDAERKCPMVCGNVGYGQWSWNGSWNTVTMSQMSICQCERR
jgi:hypothetical protein